jgi:DNA-directed RNA polymerase subunit alpha
MEIWTNGSIKPEIALVEASKILRKHLNPFVQYSELGSEVHSVLRMNTDGIDPAMEKKLNMSIGELQLSVRASNCLETENILTVRDLVTKDEDSLMEVRNFGDTTLQEVNEKLSELGLRLGIRRLSSPAPLI